MIFIPKYPETRTVYSLFIYFSSFVVVIFVVCLKMTLWQDHTIFYSFTSSDYWKHVRCFSAVTFSLFFYKVIFIFACVMICFLLSFVKKQRRDASDVKGFHIRVLVCRDLYCFVMTRGHWGSCWCLGLLYTEAESEYFTLSHQSPDKLKFG